MSLLNQNASDTRIMSLVFDNSKFEPNAKASISTLERLKNALKASKESTLFQSIEDGTRSLSGIDEVAKSLTALQSRFSQFGTFTSRITENIANDVYNSVKRIASSITIDQLSAGWAKYEEKTQAVQTIMANTKEEWASQEQQMEYVNRQLEKLNWFTDETSYNFIDMTSNVGKFINSGVKLDDAVTAMEGISTWAAKSGANVQQASHAMYNLSQAMGLGHVELMDWKSIENAQMATMEFKNLVLETAASMGTLKKQSDGVYKTLDNKIEVTSKNFRETLNKKWFTGEVLVESLKKYGEFADVLHNSMDVLGSEVSTTKVLRWVKEYANGTLNLADAAEEAGVSSALLERELKALGRSEWEFGREAFAAAQEAKTFTEAIEATKDAASSAWMNVFETLFGNYLEQRGYWTEVSEQLWESFVSPIANLGDAIESAFKKEAMIGQAAWDLLNGEDGLGADKFINAIIAAGKKFGYITDDMEITADNFRDSLSSGWLTSDLFDKIFDFTDGALELSEATENGITDIRQLRKVAEELRKDDVNGNKPGKWLFDYSNLGFNEEAFHAYVAAIEEGYEALKETEGEAATVTDDILDKADAILAKQQGISDGTVEDTKRAIEELNKLDTSYESVSKTYDGFARIVHDSEGNEVVARMSTAYYWGEILRDVIKAMAEVLSVAGEEFQNVFGSVTEGGIRNVTLTIYDLVERFRNWVANSEALRGALDAVFSIVKIKFTVMKQVFDGVLGVIEAVFGAFDDGNGSVDKGIAGLLSYVSKFSDWISETNIIGGIFKFVADMLVLAKDAATDFFNAVDPDGKSLDFFGKIGTALMSSIGSLGEFFGGFGGSFRDFYDRMKELDGLSLDSIISAFKAFKETVVDYILNFEGFAPFKEAIEDLKEALKNVLKDIGIDVNGILGFFDKVKETGSKVLEFFTGKASDAAEGGAIKGIFERIGSAFNALLTFFSGKIESIGDSDSIFSKALSAISDLLSGATTPLDLLGDALGWALDGIQVIINKFISFASGINWGKIAWTLFNMQPLLLVLGGIDDIVKLAKTIYRGITNPLSGITSALQDFVKQYKKGQLVKSLLLIALSIGVVTAALYVIAEKIDQDKLLVAILVMGILGAFLLAMNKALDIIGGASPLKAASLLIISLAIKSIAKVLKTIASLVNDNGWKNVLIATGIMAALGVVLVGVFALFSLVSGKTGILKAIAFNLVVHAIKSISKVLSSITDLVAEKGVTVLYAVGIIGALGLVLDAVFALFALVSGKTGILKAISFNLVVRAVKSIAKVLASMTELIELHGINTLYAVGIIGALGLVLDAVFALFALVSGKTGILKAISFNLVVHAVKSISSLFAPMTELIKAHGINTLYAVGVIGALGLVMDAVFALFALVSGKTGILKAISFNLVVHAVKSISQILNDITALVSKQGVKVLAAIGVIGAVGLVLVGLFALFSLIGRSSGLLKAVSIFVVAEAIKVVASVVAQLTELPDQGNLWNALLVIAGVSACIGLLAIAVGRLSKLSGFDIAGVWVVAESIRMVANVVKMLTNLKNQEGLLPALGVIAGVSACLAGVVILVSHFGNLDVNDLIGIVAVTFALSILAESVANLAKYKGDQLLAAGGAILMVSAALAAILAVASLAGGATASTGALVGAVAAVAAVAVILGVFTKIMGDDAGNAVQAAEALMIALATLLGAALLLGVIGAAGMAIGAGVVVILALILLVGLLGILAANCEDLAPKLEAAAELLGGVGEAIGAFLGGIVGGAVKQFASDLPTTGRFFDEFADIINSVDGDAFDKGMDELKKMSGAMMKVSGDTLMSGIANVFGAFYDNDMLDENGDPTRKDLWDQFQERTAKIAEALLTFQGYMEEIGEITIPVDAIDDLSNVIKNLPFNRGGFLSLFTGNELATEQDVADFKKTGEMLAKAIVGFSEALPADIDAEKLSSATGVLKAITDLGTMVLNMWYFGRSVANMVDEDSGFMAMVNGLGTAVSTLSEFNYNEEHIASMATAMDDIVEIINKLGGINIGTGEIGSNTKVDRMSTNLTKITEIISSLSTDNADNATKLASAVEKLAGVSLDGDLTDRDKVDAFKKSVRDLGDAFNGVIKDYTKGATGGGLDLGAVLSDYMEGATSTASTSNLGDDLVKNLGFDQESITNSLQESFGGVFGEGGTFASMLSGMFGEAGEGADYSGEFLKSFGLDQESMSSALQENLGGLFGEGGELSTMFTDFFGGEGGTMNFGDFFNFDESSLGDFSSSINNLKDMLGMTEDGELGQLTITPVLETGTVNDQIVNLKDMLVENGSLTADMAGLVEANVDTSGIESAISTLQSSNETSLHAVSERISDVVREIVDLANAIESIDLVLNTGVLVGEITPMVNRRLGQDYG